MIGMNHGRDDAGLIPRICGMVFNPEPRAQASRYPSGAHARAYDACVRACGQEARVSVTISVVEVYSENLFDLLAPPMLRNQPLKLKQVSASSTVGLDAHAVQLEGVAWPTALAVAVREVCMHMCMRVCMSV